MTVNNTDVLISFSLLTLYHSALFLISAQFTFQNQVAAHFFAF